MLLLAISEQALGLTAGLFTSTSMLPQLIKTYQEKKASDISFLMLIVLLVGVSLWIVYGVLKHDMPIIITNSISVAINITVCFFKIRYRSNKEPQQEQKPG